MFAEQYERNEEGFILFPNDQKLRRELFIPEAMSHPAKANLYLTAALIQHTTQVEDTVMDITAGSGSVLIATRFSRKVIAIDISKQYCEWMQASRDNMDYPVLLEFPAIVINSDCRDVLPLPCNAIIFSPPYSNVMRKAGGTLSLIIKDKIVNGMRVPLGLAALKMMVKAGFEFSEWYKWKPPGHMFIAMKKKKGERVVEDEHIILCRRPL